MENDFDNRSKNEFSEEVSHRIRWSALIIWPVLVITIFIFIFSMAPFVRDESGKIKFHESINNLKQILTRQKNVRIEIIRPNENLLAIRSSIDTYLLNTGQYPTTLNDLVVDPGLIGWTGPYFKPSQLNDKFGNPYIYIPSAKGNYKLISYGADGKPDGEDDNADVIYDY